MLYQNNIEYKVFNPNTPLNPSNLFVVGYSISGADPDDSETVHTLYNESSFPTYQEALARRVELNRERRPTLQEWFDEDPPAEYVHELTGKDGKGIGVFYMKVLDIKKMLSVDFTKWGTSNFKIEPVRYGTNTLFNCQVTLDLIFRGESYSFEGGYTIDASIYTQSTNWAGVGVSMCLKNAVKNIGRKYGMYLNEGEVLDAELLDKDFPPIVKEKAPDKVGDAVRELAGAMKKTPNR